MESRVQGAEVRKQDDGIQMGCQAEGDRRCAGIRGAEQGWKPGGAEGGVQRAGRTHCSPAALPDPGSVGANELISHASQCDKDREHRVV